MGELSPKEMGMVIELMYRHPAAYDESIEKLQEEADEAGLEFMDYVYAMYAKYLLKGDR